MWSPVEDDDVRSIVREAGVNGVVARGLGRSYGDAAQNAGGGVIDGPARSGILDLNLRTGIARILAGTSLDDLMRWLVPLGWFVPVTPGTRMVTVGGAIAADIHGKNHHRKGSWCDHVLSLRLVDGRGEVRDVNPQDDPEVFWATAGGMGLTGIVLDATVQLQAVGSSKLLVDSDRASDLDDVMSLMIDGDDAYDYSVAWIDVMAKGKHLGRSVLDRGRFATREEVLASGDTRPTDYSTHVLPSPPDILPSGLINKLTARAFNELWFRKAPVRRRDALMGIEQFFHPLDMVAEWNRVYGRRGFLQWQYVVPDEAGDFVRSSLERIAAAGLPSFLAVLKRMGTSNPGHLSFPMPGWTLAFDAPVAAGLHDLFDELDREVVDWGGRLYLAKDSRLDPDLLPKMYPRLDEWRDIREKLDPDHRFRSDMGRRLGLV
ncbi:FAD-binding oxidoreductase [Dermatobacter hominis]|uniref:FAD-binding oxidoreductase n=1 Tax=Dermatobacter hominis TaxID=2884263 RepID=UPI001D0F917A|nr:FAD-binding oxidoreductase [Dermatobacter hominis]UDY37030.1 FAD-binding oxidoreductase [Dermatobacter hominis]